MHNRRGIGRTEIIVAIVVVVVVILIAIPLFSGTSTKTARAEVPLHVDAIKLAEVTYQEAFDEYVSAEAAPRAMTAVDENKVPWSPTPGFVTLAWEPAEGELYGAYMVVTTDDGFTVTGTCDVDGDGVRAIYTATAEENATRTTAEDVY